MKLIAKLWIGIAVLIILSPLGLILPGYFKAGSAWGEWGIDEIQKMTGYVPGGLAKFASFWNAPIPDYAFRGWEEKGLGHLSLAYVISAAAGIVVVAIIMFLLAKILLKK